MLIVDELDRIEDDEVRAVAQLIKAVGDIKGVSYLAAYDADRVVRALGRGEGDERIRSGEHYLEKIIQYSVPMRPLFADDVQALIETALADHELQMELPRSNSQTALFQLLIAAIQTPREVKRLVGAFSVLGATVRGEICSYDVLGYCWILTKSPNVRDQIAAHVDDLVDDPSEASMIKDAVRRMAGEANPDVGDVLGEAATPHKKIIELLFPRFAGTSDESEGNRICRRRNLLRLLYLGNPPGMVARTELEELWDNADILDLEAKLRGLMHDGRLASTLERLDDLVTSLPTTGDRFFWVALSRALYRKSDWLQGPEAAGALAEDGATTLCRLGAREPETKPRLSEAIAALVAYGDLVLVPWILRKHLFAYGLTTASDAPRGGGVLNVEFVKNLADRELPRYRRAVIDGIALRRLPNLEVVYTIVNSGLWGSTLRMSLTSQINSLEAISTFAGLCVPPGVASTRASLDQLIDANEVDTRIAALIASNESPTDPWLAVSLRRLQRVLAGKHPDSSWDD